MPSTGKNLEGNSPTDPEEQLPPQQQEPQQQQPAAEAQQPAAANQNIPSAGEEEKLDEPLESETLLNKCETNGDLQSVPKDTAAEQKNGKNGALGNGSKEICVEMNVAEGASMKDEEGTESVAGKRRACDTRCVVIGLLVVIIMVGGASVAILAHRFRVETRHEFHFASYYTDDMILQRAPHRAVVWGYGPLLTQNTTVIVRLTRGESGGGASTLEDDNVVQQHTVNIRNTVAGQVWRVVLDEVSDTGLFTLTAELNTEEEQDSSSEEQRPSVSLHRVLFGDVWLCAGQENMQMSLDMVMNGDQELQRVDAEDKNLPIRLFSLLPAKSDIPWYNIRGVQLPWSKPSSGALAGGRVAEGQIASHFSGLCWLYGKQLQSQLQYPIGLVSITYADSSIDDWMPPAGHEACDQRPGGTNPQRHVGLSRVWNAMVNPLLDMSMFGLIWYQGEKDALTGGGHNYNCSVVELVKHWREESFRRTLSSTNQHFPIGIVQLAPHRNESHLTYGYTDIRWRQTANYGYLPNPQLSETFTAVTVDLGDSESPHGSMMSRRKQEVADRLVSGALAVGYRRNDARYQGPLPARYSVSTSQQTLSIFFNTTNIQVRSKTGFEVCCSTNQSLPCPSSFMKVSYAPGREWVSAPMVSDDGGSISISTSGCSSGTHVVALRYAWRESPCGDEREGCAVYERGDPVSGDKPLPMPPYIRVGLKDDGIVRPLGLARVDLI